MQSDMTALGTSQKYKCFICGSDDLVKLTSNNDRRKGLKGTWVMHKCNHCGVLGLYPSPSGKELSDYYSVYSHNKKIVFSESKGSRYPRLRKIFHWVTGDVDPRDFISPDPDDVVLDYGSGEAGSLYDFHARGVKISGAEISSDMVSLCQTAGLDVQQVINLDQIPFENHSFDIVYLMQVFEHLGNPHVFLDELLRVTKPGGQVFIAVPNSKSLWRKVFGSNWVTGWFAPFHLYLYDDNSLPALAQQHGFDVLKSWSSTPEAWFRLNIKASLYPKETRLEDRKSLIDSAFVRFPLMAALRLMELFIPQRDCLVVKLVKRAE